MAGLRESPLEPIFKEIAGAINAELYHAALAVALTLPDICCALATVGGASPRGGYQAWFTDHMPDYKEALSGEDAYRLRCGLLHQGRTYRSDMKWDRVVFGGKDSNHLIFVEGNYTEAGELPNILQLSTERFCTDVVEAARAWYVANAGDANVRRHSENVLRHREDILAPYIGGITGIC